MVGGTAPPDGACCRFGTRSGDRPCRVIGFWNRFFGEVSRRWSRLVAWRSPPVVVARAVCRVSTAARRSAAAESTGQTIGTGKVKVALILP